MCALYFLHYGDQMSQQKVFLNDFTLIGTFVLVYTEKKAHKSYRIVF